MEFRESEENCRHYASSSEKETHYYAEGKHLFKVSYWSYQTKQKNSKILFPKSTDDYKNLIVFRVRGNNCGK